jgi:hypothetical protein
MEIEPSGTQNEEKKEFTDSSPDPTAPAAVQHGSRSARNWFSGVSSALGVGLFLAGSAALGGIAMVLWNRRLLTEMRNASPGEPEQYTLFDE